MTTCSIGFVDINNLLAATLLILSGDIAPVISQNLPLFPPHGLKDRAGAGKALGEGVNGKRLQEQMPILFENALHQQLLALSADASPVQLPDDQDNQGTTPSLKSLVLCPACGQVMRRGPLIPPNEHAPP